MVLIFRNGLITDMSYNRVNMDEGMHMKHHEKYIFTSCLYNHCLRGRSQIHVARLKFQHQFSSCNNNVSSIDTQDPVGGVYVHTAQVS